ncbi:MAG: GDP-mannose 4,6-dehydratase [Chloroflexi bacterium]|nr:GDP-mannose 4,6-dehydratase [Chloroflexota bacterium]
MSILVTGCAGFIASNVCRLLLEEGHTIHGVDNLNDAYDVRLKHWRLEQLESNPNFHFHNMDISDYPAMLSLFEADTYSSVINLGARAGVRYSVEDPWIYYQANTIGTLNLLELCRKFEVGKFVLSSTSSAYGADTPRPFNEDSNTSKPLSPYAASKMAAETLTYTYHHLYGIDCTVLRYFTVYGPAGRPDMVMFIFIQAIAEGRPITVFGDGRQERDFTYVDDIARGTVAALKPVGYEIINLGSDNPVVLADVITMMEDCLEKKAKIEYAPMHAADVLATWANVDKAENLLGWKAQMSIEEGVRRTVDWYTQNREWAKGIKT